MYLLKYNIFKKLGEFPIKIFYDYFFIDFFYLKSISINKDNL